VACHPSRVIPLAQGFVPAILTREWDMLFALIGAIVAQLILAKVHDRQLASMAR
jgi:hypothetical protein